MSRRLIALILLSHTVVACSDTDKLTAFTTDGCSAFPDGTLEHGQLWLDCCTQHDVAYWAGGSYDERQTADQDLRDCVAEVGEPAIAAMMLAGVRVGGTPYLPTRFRWGYGWSYPRGYKPLSDQERRVVGETLAMEHDANQDGHGQ